MVVKRVEYELTGNSRGAVKAFDEAAASAESAGGKMEDKFGKSTSKVGGFFHNLAAQASSFGIPFTGALDDVGDKFDETEGKGSSFFSKLSAVGGIATAAVGAGLVAVGVESVHMADEFEPAHARLVTAIQNSGQAFSKFSGQINEQGNQFATLGYNMTDYQGALAQLTSATNSPTAALKNMSIAANLAAEKHLSLEKAAVIVGKVFEGNTTALKRYGIDLGVASGGAVKVQTAQQSLAKSTQALLFLEAQDHEKKKLTLADEQKLVLAHQAVTTAQQNLTQAQHAGELGLAALGERMKGAAAAQADTFSGRIKGLKAQVENLGIKFGLFLIPKLEDVGTAIANVIGWFEKHSAIAKVVAVVIGTVLVSAIGAYIASMAIAAATTVAAAAPFIAIGVAIAGLVVGLIYAWNHFTMFRTIVMGVVNFVKAGITDFVHVIQGLWKTFGSTIVQYATSTWDNIKQYIQGALQYVTGIFNLFKDLFTGNWSNLWADVQQIIGGAWKMVTAIVGQAVAALEELLGLAWDAIKGGVTSAWGGILSFFESLPGRILGALGSLISGFYNFGANIIHALANGITSVGSLVGGAITGILKHVPGAGLITKYLAAGGTVNGGAAYIVGEQGPELFIPDVGGQIVPNDALNRSVPVAGPVGAGGAGGGVTVNVQVSGYLVGSTRELGQLLSDALIRYQRASGTRWQTSGNTLNLSG